MYKHILIPTDGSELANKAASHGRSGFDAVMRGSETMDVLASSRIPVLVLR